MMSVTGTTVFRETGNDHIGPELADHPHHIAKDQLLIPLFQSLFRAFGKTEIVSSCKKLFGAINAAGRQQLLCSY